MITTERFDQEEAADQEQDQLVLGENGQHADSAAE